MNVRNVYISVVTSYITLKLRQQLNKFMKFIIQQLHISATLSAPLTSYLIRKLVG